MFGFLFLLTIRRLWRNPFRTGLSLLQIALGAFAVMVVTSLLVGGQKPNADIFRLQTGGNNSTINPYALFKTNDVQRIVQNIPSIEMATVYSPFDTFDPIIRVKQRLYRVKGMVVAGASYPQIIPLEFLQGGFYAEQDILEGRRVVVISQSVAQQLFATVDAVGKSIDLNSDWGQGRNLLAYQVVGVFKDMDSSNSSQGENNHHIFRPPLQDVFAAGTPEVLIKAKPQQALIAQQEVLNTARVFYKSNQKFVNNNSVLAVSSLSGQTTGSNENNFNKVSFSVIGFAILLICSISIFSIQVVSVTEQTREIGLQKALGASNRAIIGENLFSSGLLAIAGALLGLGLALVLIPLLNRGLVTGDLVFVVSPFSTLLGVVIVVAMGIIFGFFPALMAARLRPVQAFKEG